MKDKYRQLLNKTYELEGLLMLAINRDPLPQNIEALIEQKRRDIASLQLSPKGVTATPTRQSEKAAAPSPPQQPEKPAQPVKQADDFFYALNDDDDDEASSAKPVAVAPPRRKTFTHNKSNRKPVFSLNDRFLFIRETFYGDAAAFNRAVEGVGAHDSYQKAEDYLINDFGLDPDDETDARFLEIVASVFK